jgi:putative ABC transport system permease protein
MASPMIAIALKMLFGDQAKYLGLVFGVTFATLLMAQQVTIFVGLMARTASTIYAVKEVDIWVMHPSVNYIDEVENLREVELSNVRSVPGVLWAEPFYKGNQAIRMPNGTSQQVQMIAVDDVTQVGLCSDMVLGNANVIRQPQSAIIDKAGFSFTWPGEALTLGKQIELNDNRLNINAICETNTTFLTFPIMYVSYNTFKEITPQQRTRLPFVLVKAKAGQDIGALIKSIEARTGLQAVERNEFAWRSIKYYLTRTGIPINFGITILLAAIIGAAITAQTFNIFIVENLKQFAAMKAIGATNSQLMQVMLIQALVVGLIGYGLGIGFTAVFFDLLKDVPSLKGFILLWQIMLGTFITITLVILASVTLSLGKVFRLDPAIVFRG